MSRTVFADRVQETGTLAGDRNSVALGGATAGFRAFASVCQPGDRVHVFVHRVDNQAWETAEYEFASGGSLVFPFSFLALGSFFDGSDPVAVEVSMTLVAERARLPLVQVYDVPGTYTWTRNRAASLVEVTVFGGGGAGGRGNIFGASGGGGGAGGMAHAAFDASSLLGSLTVTVGAGGTNRGAGAQSSFDTLLRAGGGGAGQSDPPVGGGTGGTGSNVGMATAPNGGIGSGFTGAGTGGAAVLVANGMFATPAGGGGGGFSGSPPGGGGGVPAQTWANNGAAVAAGGAGGVPNGDAGVTPASRRHLYGGTGGGGGADAGGNGGFPGGGGGGTNARTFPTGDGGNGCVVVISS